MGWPSGITKTLDTYRVITETHKGVVTVAGDYSDLPSASAAALSAAAANTYVYVYYGNGNLLIKLGWLTLSPP
ncbi:MAG: hypothetical protein KDH96_02655 [Candidatus Riesia sp.]|nr:hypothetical protein [Candidatus Riesia sp.]